MVYLTRLFELIMDRRGILRRKLFETGFKCFLIKIQRTIPLQKLDIGAK